MNKLQNRNQTEQTINKDESLYRTGVNESYFKAGNNNFNKTR
jgi:hypothetical protein